MNEKVQGLPLIGGYLGLVFVLSGFILLLPLLTIPFYPEEIIYAKNFIIPSVIAILAGYLLMLTIKGKPKGNLYKNQDAIIVVFSWVIAIVVSAMPFILTGQYNFTQAIFETTSGFSTTGLSVVDVTTCPRIYLMFRSIMLFFGGIGLVLVVTSAISDTHGMRLYTAEGHSDKLMPNLAKSARLIIVIYSGYILAGTVAYVFCGMPIFDSLNHSIAAVSTGGFSTQAASIGAYNSICIEAVTIVLMLLGGTNFFIHLLLLKGKLKMVFAHCETKFVIFSLSFTIPLIAFLIMDGVTSMLPSALRQSVFQTISALTTTGFQTITSFTNLSSSLIMILILLMLIGGGAGSTAGGMKQYRVYITLKTIILEIHNKLGHKRKIYVGKVNRYGNKNILEKNDQMYSIIFVITYFLIFLTGTFIFTLFGNSLQNAMFEFSSALGTVGLSVGITGYDANPVILWTATVGMFIGRLEIFVVFLGLSRLIIDFKNRVVKTVENKTTT